MAIKKYMLNPEKNNFDTSGAALTIATTWTIENMSNIAEGDDNINRTGRSVKFLGLNFRGGVTLGTTATLPSRCRIVLFIDTMQIGSAGDPGATVIFNTNNIDSQRNQQGSPGRFKFLYDRTISLSPGGVETMHFIVKRPLNILTKYIGTTGVDASNYKNAIYLMYVTDNATVAPVISYTNRLWFIDN